ncbi:MAG: RidA family protein [Candidatus Bipolaricaulota bacterium]|jgi:2-iminobutanoate/2-iminopropanoate deaminase|nr:RidA family protein [Candidatus Bipolaricaulota bacterium]
MIRRPITTTGAPGAIGPYSQGIRAGGLFYTSGQLPLTPSGELIRDDIPSAARQALENVRAILSAGGATMKDVVKVTVYLTDMAHFAAVNEVYAQFFSEPYPARTCVAVARLPLDAPLEIEAHAVVG